MARAGAGGSVLLAVLLLTATAVRAQVRGFELGPAAGLVATDPIWGGGGLTAAVRPGGGTRIALNLMAGGRGGRTLGRMELLGQLLLSPGRRHGVGVYGEGGVAGVLGRGGEGFLVLGLGLERAPGGGAGWFVEGGIGGGARLVVGWRWRWLSDSP